MMIKQRQNIYKWSPIFFQVGLICSLAITMLAFEWKFYDASALVQSSMISDKIDELIEVPVTIQPPPPPPKVEQPTIIEVPDEEEITEEIEIDLDVEIEQNEIIVEIEEEEKEIEIEEEETDEIFTIVEEQASFKTGEMALLEFIVGNMKYPERARRMAIEGKVYVNFVVEKDGAITNVITLKGIGAGCDEEAIRIVKLLPPWNPAKQRGRPVRSRVTIPLIFRIN